ncbi:hypothetical protein L7F22_035486 [Adiantum nelumboides]|nr:hypothetical protein [Adiantum nelumboides]
MARTGSSSKFVPVNLNNSYGQTVPLSNGGTNSSVLGRSRSFSNSYGGMVSLSRPSRAASSSSSSATVSRASKLAVPRPVNLPSLRREHSGNDPTIALVGSLGSSGWNKQSGDDIVDVNATRSDALKGDATTWGNRTSAPDNSSQSADRRLLSGGRQSPYRASSLGEVPNYAAPAAPAPVAKAVVFRGEDFPSLQAAVAPPSPSIPPMPRSRDSQQKQQDKHPGSSNEDNTRQPLGDDPRESNRLLDRQLQPAQPVRMHARPTFLGQVDDDNVDRVSTYPRGPSPLIKVTHTSNWADDERETLSNVRTQDSAQDSDWNERNDGFHTVGNWSLDRNADVDFRRPTSRVGYPGRNEPAFATLSTPASKFVYVKDGDLRRDHVDGGKFENHSRGDLERLSNNFGRNDVLKRGWSFPAGADYNVNRETRYESPNIRVDQDGHSNGKAYLRDGNNARHDGLGRKIFPQDTRPGLQHQDGGQWHDSKFGKDVFLGRQGFPGSVTASGPRSSRGTGFPFSTSDAKVQSGMDHKREKRVSGFYGQVQEDPFLGDGISSRPPPFYVSQQKMKKESLSSDDYRDPARESFEAELERVEKMLEQERQRAIEERDRAIEIARKEQEEQERIAREEEELRLKLEEEAREAAYRAQKEAEEAMRKVEEARRVREEEKRMADVEEERRKEAAKRKLLELEERMAKRDLEKREEEVSPKERASAMRTVTTDVTMDRQEGGIRKNEINRTPHWKLLSSSGKVDQDSEQVLSKAPVLGSTPLPSILRSPRLSTLAKEENGFPIEGGRITQSWKRDTSISGYEPRPAQKGPPKFLHLRTDRSQQESEDQLRGPFLRNASAQKSPVRLNESRAPDDVDERDWWVRDTNRSISTYPQSSDFSEYPPYGRVRQSLPRQPRVLPPPPGNAMSRKQIFQADEPQSESLVSGTKYAVGPLSNEENRSSAGGESAGAVSQDASVHVSKPFEAVPSEEMVLSDAGSQFSDDTVEDVVVEPEQEQEPHSDVVSETYSDREVDEISDFTEAQESSEDGEPQKPADWEVCQRDQNQECLVRCLEEVRAEALGSLQGQPEVEKDGLIACSEIKDEDVDRHIAQNAHSSSLIEDAASRSLEGPVNAVSVSEQVDKQTPVLTTELQDGQAAVRKAEELTSEKPVQDQEIHPFLNQAPFLSVGTSDVTQIRHLEGLSSRQSLVQQFQQPFSFMAVPLPQSGSLNHVGASLPMLSSVHTLSNQQELPFHVQLGLLPSVPLLPNAIQIGSIQMPLHIHPQLPQLTHLHGHQQAPIFQFGQIGPSLALSQPISTTQISLSPVQVLNAPGQNVSLQHSESQAEIVVAVDTNINSPDCNVHGTLDNAACVEGTSIASTGHGFVQNEHTELSPGASGNSIGSTITAERETELSFVKPKLEKAATDTTSKFDAQAGEKIISNDKLESTWVGDIGEFDNNARLSGRHVRGGRRRNNLRYQGILGRGRGRFHGRGGHRYSYQASQGGVESWPEGGTKRFSRGKVYQRNYRRVEYRVREPTPLFDLDTAAPNSASGPSLSIDDTKDGGGYRYVKRGLGGHPSNSGDENGSLGGAVPHSSSQVTANAPLANQSTATATRKTKSMLKKYEAENAEDAPFRTGVVRVFEQPGIETPNDKDDFIKVRSKRQLLRELREQCEKENKSKAQDAGSKEPAGKKQQRSSAKIGASNGTTSTKIGASNGTISTNFSKNIGKRQSTRSDGKLNMPSLPNGTIATSSATSTKRSLTPSKAGLVTSSFRTVSVESESLTGYGDDIHASEHLTTAAWGGQRSNQEVVSLTQIQLEEAMKPFRLDVPFSESMHSPERAVSTLEPVLPCSSSLSAEKIVTSVKASGPLSSLLAGEKIQFGAVTSPTLIPPDNCSPAPVCAVRTGSPINFGSDPPHISSHSNNFVTGYLDSHLDPTYSLKGGSERKDDGYEAKVVDFEAEAAAEAAASAVVAAAINSEDLIDSHPDTRVSEINVGCNSISSGSSAAIAMTGHIQHASDYPIAVALPADLSVETPPSLFQASTMTLPNSSGVLLQSLQGGAPTFPCLEMGPLIGGPVFNFGPREDASMASMEPGLSGWQQRHVGAPDSYYGAPPFLGPAGLSGIQGHPHMLVYTNPYTPVGQFGQLGVSFMGATYHPSGKQPDWSHVPIPSASSGALVMNDGDLSVGSNGIMASQHHNGASNLMQAHRAPVAGSSVMSVATPPNLFDTGFAAPFQVPQMDALVQSHWSKAPAPPVHSVSAAGSTLPLSRPAVDFNIQVHPPKVFSSQGGHRTNPVDGASAFRQLSMMNPAKAGSSFSSPGDACAQFPDELGLGDSLPTVTNMQSGAIGPLSDADHSGKTVPIGSPGLRVPRGRRSTQSSQGHLNNANSGELISNSSYPEQSRGGLIAIDSHTKSMGRIGSPGMRNTAVQLLEQRTSKQSLPRDSAGGEWNRGSLRKGASGRVSNSERAGSSVSSKMKQIYVAKPAGDSRKLSAACS